MFDVQSVRNEFPILSETMHNKPLCFLDNAASTQKPRCVIDKVYEIYTKSYANVHRGSYQISDRLTDEFEQTRKVVADFVCAKSERDIVFTKGTTEGINLIAQSLRQFYFKAGDEIILSQMEHHANIVPWQMIANELGLIIRVIPVLLDGSFDIEAYKLLLSDKTKLVSITHISNVLGTVNPIKEMISLAKAYDAAVVIDGAQGVMHEKVDVQSLGCDFYVFSAHKLYGPTGVGVLYVSERFSNIMPPYQGGGNMIKNVTFDETTYQEFPYNFEAGTPNIIGVIAFREALSFINQVGLEKIKLHEKELLDVAQKKLKQIDGLKILGNTKDKASIVTFIVEGAHANDIGMLLDTYGIAVRTGHHCAQPLLACFNVPSTVRSSFAVYNTIEEANYLAESLAKVVKMLR